MAGVKGRSGVYIRTKPGWNKGLTKETDDRVAGYATKLTGNPKVSIAGRKGGKATKGIKRSKAFKDNLSKIQKGRTFKEEYGEQRAIEIANKISKTHSERLLKNPEYNARKFYRTGHFYSQKNNCTIFYRSSYELQAFNILEQISKVVSYTTSPYYIKYNIGETIHRYIPDVLITYNSGEKELIEIKPASRIKQNEGGISNKLEAGRKFAEENNMKFSVWTEKELFTQHI